MPTLFPLNKTTLGIPSFHARVWVLVKEGGGSDENVRQADGLDEVLRHFLGVEMGHFGGFLRGRFKRIEFWLALF